MTTALSIAVLIVSSLLLPVLSSLQEKVDEDHQQKVLVNKQFQELNDTIAHESDFKRVAEFLIAHREQIEQKTIDKALEQAQIKNQKIWTAFLNKYSAQEKQARKK